MNMFVLMCVCSDTDACVEPVLSLRDAAQHPHNKSVTSLFNCLFVYRGFCYCMQAEGNL